MLGCYVNSIFSVTKLLIKQSEDTDLRPADALEIRFMRKDHYIFFEAHIQKNYVPFYATQALSKNSFCGEAVTRLFTAVFPLVFYVH